MSLVPVLEIGGTHVTAAVVDSVTGTLTAPPARTALDSNADAARILTTLTNAGVALGVRDGAHWGIAMPDPFDYPHGIGRFHGVGKFEALDGVNVGASLSRSLRADAITFVNDADAFTLGEALGEAGPVRPRRCVGLTLGTGVGSGWVVDGSIVSAGAGLPPGGRIHLLMVHDAPLEQTMSRRAIRRAYLAATGDATADVRDIAAFARAGDVTARQVLAYALRSLGEALGPCLHEFAADILIVGGSMSLSWDLLEPWLRDGLAATAPGIAIRTSPDTELAGLRGAARAMLDR